MSLLPYNPNSLGIGGKLLTIAKTGATGLPNATAITAANSGDLLTFASAHNLKTGDKLTLTVGSLTGPSAGTFYAIVASATTIQLAASRALAIAGTAVEITGDGSGTITYVGESYRAMNWRPEAAAREVGRTDEAGDDAEFTLRATPVRQSGLQLQLATSTSPVPRCGMEFADPAVATTTYVVVAVTPSYQAGEIWMCEITYRSTGNQTD
jgi:hypothetical protein